MTWTVQFHDEFEPEYDLLPEAVQDELLARIGLLEEFGPNLGRPTVDTLTASSFPNMKEIRFNCDGFWRFAFAFDQTRSAIVLFQDHNKLDNHNKFSTSLLKQA